MFGEYERRAQTAEELAAVRALELSAGRVSRATPEVVEAAQAYADAAWKVERLIGESQKITEELARSRAELDEYRNRLHAAVKNSEARLA